MTNEQQLGMVIVVTGPSGAGKDSVIHRAKERGLAFGTVTTTTSRPMRPGEGEGSPYYFVTREEFERKIANGEMIEWAEVYGNMYGSTREELEHARKKHPIVVIKVDPQGARTFKEIIPDAVTFFIKPPSFTYLEKRLINRASDSQDVIQKRLETARAELKQLDQWDYLILNDEGQLDKAADEFISLIHKEARKNGIQL